MRILPPTYAPLLIGETLLVAALFVAAAYFTRATRRRVLAAVVSCLMTFMLIGPLIDFVLYPLGLFRFPGGARLQPLAIYAQAAVGFAIVALVAWRLVRRFGSPGLLGLVVAFMILLPPRDYVVGTFTHWVEFTRGAASLLADSIGNGLAVLISFGLMRLVGGPAGADPLRGVGRQPRSAEELAPRV
jgi:hypothetical protein